MAAATNTPVSILETVGEGGAWGIALLAPYMSREHRELLLPSFLERIFSDNMGDAQYNPIPKMWRVLNPSLGDTTRAWKSKDPLLHI